MSFQTVVIVNWMSLSVASVVIAGLAADVDAQRLAPVGQVSVVAGVLADDLQRGLDDGHLYPRLEGAVPRKVRLIDQCHDDHVGCGGDGSQLHSSHCPRGLVRQPQVRLLVVAGVLEAPTEASPATQLGPADVEAVAVGALVGVHAVPLAELGLLDLPCVVVGLSEGGEPALLALALVPAQHLLVGHVLSHQMRSTAARAASHIARWVATVRTNRTVGTLPHSSNGLRPALIAAVCALQYRPANWPMCTRSDSSHST
jgi:hypothetical protein